MCEVGEDPGGGDHTMAHDARLVGHARSAANRDTHSSARCGESRESGFYGGATRVESRWVRIVAYLLGVGGGSSRRSGSQFWPVP